MTKKKHLISDEVLMSYIHEIQTVIERCFTRYMSKSEIELFVVAHAKEDRKSHIAYCFPIVWKRLQQNNPDFFRIYQNKLKLKDQILNFNELLEKQAHTMSLGAGTISNPYDHLSVSPLSQSQSMSASCITSQRGQYVPQPNMPQNVEPISTAGLQGNGSQLISMAGLQGNGSQLMPDRRMGFVHNPEVFRQTDMVMSQTVNPFSNDVVNRDTHFTPPNSYPGSISSPFSSDTSSLGGFSAPISPVFVENGSSSGSNSPACLGRSPFGSFARPHYQTGELSSLPSQGHVNYKMQHVKSIPSSSNALNYNVQNGGNTPFDPFLMPLVNHEENASFIGDAQYGDLPPFPPSLNDPVQQQIYDMADKQEESPVFGFMDDENFLFSGGAVQQSETNHANKNLPHYGPYG